MEGFGSRGLGMTVNAYLLAGRRKKVTFQTLSPYFDILRSAMNVRSVSGNAALRMQRPSAVSYASFRSNASATRTTSLPDTRKRVEHRLRRQDSRLLTQHRSDRRRSRPDRHTGGKQTQENMQRFSKGEEATCMLFL